MKAFSITDIGERRKTNQDYVLCETNAVGNLPNLFIVADGMGGHNAGDNASRFCVDYITQHINSDQTSPMVLIEEAIKTQMISCMKAKQQENLSREQPL